MSGQVIPAFTFVFPLPDDVDSDDALDYAKNKLEETLSSEFYRNGLPKYDEEENTVQVDVLFPNHDNIQEPPVIPDEVIHYEMASYSRAGTVRSQEGSGDEHKGR